MNQLPEIKSIEGDGNKNEWMEIKRKISQAGRCYKSVRIASCNKNAFCCEN